MLVHHSAYLLEREIVPVVVRHPHSVPRRERLEGSAERLPEHRHIAGAIGVRRVALLVTGVWRRFLAIVEWLNPALGAEVIDMTLRQHGAHPRQYRASAVEVAEDRTAPPVANLEPVHLRPYRIRQLAPAHLVAGDRARSGVKRRPETGDEMFPRPGFARLARERKAQVLGMNRVDISVDAAAVEHARRAHAAIRGIA